MVFALHSSRRVAFTIHNSHSSFGSKRKGRIRSGESDTERERERTKTKMKKKINEKKKNNMPSRWLPATAAAVVVLNRPR